MILSADPLISIITPTFNRAAFLPECIASVLAQTYPHFEMIIVDNGSTDGTRELVAANRDPRIRYVWQENSGTPVSPRNRGFSMARGEIICLLDSDDVWMPHKLALQVKQFQDNPELGMVYANCFLMNREGEMKGSYWDYHKPHRGRILEALLWDNFVPALTVAIPKCVLDRIGNLAEKYAIAHDWDLYLRIARFYPVDYSVESVAKFRIHSASMTRDRLASRREVLAVLHKWCFQEQGTHLADAVKHRIWSKHCFRAGLEMLTTAHDKADGQKLLRDAARWQKGNPLYWMGVGFSVAPRWVSARLVEGVRRWRSMERAL